MAPGSRSTPVSERMHQCTRVQTNASGSYTWTFPTAYANGVIPNVHIDVEDGAGSIWSSSITAISNTSVSIQLTRTTMATILGVNVLSVAPTPQAYVHIIAMIP